MLLQTSVSSHCRAAFSLQYEPVSQGGLIGLESHQNANLAVLLSLRLVGLLARQRAALAQHRLVGKPIASAHPADVVPEPMPLLLSAIRWPGAADRPCPGDADLATHSCSLVPCQLLLYVLR